MSAPVTREHRLMAAHILGYSEREPFVAKGVADGFGQGTNFSDIAQAIADAEARGRAAERADVVAWLQAVKDGTRACRGWVRHDVERGCHVGAATKHADSGSSSDEPGR
jgi:hypothetical protein